MTADANAKWNAGDAQAEMLPVIAKDAGMDEEATAATIATFVFPSVDEQLSDKWLGGGAANFMLGVANDLQGRRQHRKGPRFLRERGQCRPTWDRSADHDPITRNEWPGLSGPFFS